MSGGSLVVDGVVGRAHAPGDPLVYASGPEYRDLSEVRSIVAQLVGKPVRLGHDGAVVGRIDKAWLDGDRAVARMTITDASAQDAIAAGTKELSLGYACDVDARGYQHNIKIDHLAVVDTARCGAVCSLRVDTCTCGAATADHSTDAEDAKLNAAARGKLAPESFAVPGTRSLPIEDPAHVRAAMSRFGQHTFASPAEKKAAYRKILAKAKALGVESAGFEKAWSSKIDADACTLATIVHTRGVHMPNPNQDQALIELAAAASTAEKAKATAETALAKETARADAAEGVAATLRAQLAEADKNRHDQGAIDKLDHKIQKLEQLAAAEKARADAAESPERLRAAVKARVSIETAAGIVLGDQRLDGFSDRDLMLAVLEKLNGKDAVPSARSDEYVRACFDTAIESYSGSRDALNRLRDVVMPIDVKPHVDSRTARDKMEEKNRNAWKPTIVSAGSK